MPSSSSDSLPRCIPCSVCHVGRVGSATSIAHETHKPLSLYLMITPQGMRVHSGKTGETSQWKDTVGLHDGCG